MSKSSKITAKIIGIYPIPTYHSFEKTFDSEEELLEWWREYQEKNTPHVRDLHIIY